jgi:CcmD family protein
MPKNAEYVIAAYAIVIGVVVFYTVGLQLKLASIKTRLQHLKNGKSDAAQKA